MKLQPKCSKSNCDTKQYSEYFTKNALPDTVSKTALLILLYIMSKGAPKNQNMLRTITTGKKNQKSQPQKITITTRKK